MFQKASLLMLALFGWYPVWSQTQLTLEKLPSPINTESYDEIAPVLSYDGQTLYFTKVGYPEFDKTLTVSGKNLSLSLSQRQYDRYLANIYSSISGSRIRNATTSDYNQDVWIATFNKNEFASLNHPGPPLNNALPNSICALTPENNSFLVLNQFSPEGGMNDGFSIIQRVVGEWSFPKPVAIENYYTQSASVNATMSPDGEVLVLSLQRQDSYGQNDLYVSFKNGVGGWTEPMNMGSGLNSKFSEMTPTISEDKKTIYFASNRSNAMGGKDIYRSRRNSDSWTDWSVPRRFVAPINSRYDDAQPFFSDRTGYLYFTSNRAGSSDIYRVKVAEPKKEEVVVKGIVRNSVTGEPMAAKVLYGPTDTYYFVRYFKSKDGHFEFRLPKGETYKLMAKKGDFLSTFKTILSKKGKYLPLQEITLWMSPNEENTEIKIEPIYFQQSESTILEPSYAALDDLLMLLQQNEQLHIRVEGHTENRGKPKDLLDLSEARAFAVKRYLMDRGIDSQRITTKGFGGTKPVKPNRNEELRRKNRRVEVRINKIE
ncbi:MAG: OmpA family protein [Bacteroidota bacterium]